MARVNRDSYEKDLTKWAAKVYREYYHIPTYVEMPRTIEEGYMYSLMNFWLTHHNEHGNVCTPVNSVYRPAIIEEIDLWQA